MTTDETAAMQSQGAPQDEPGQAQDTTAAGDTAPSPTGLMTQEQVNAIVQERLARERAKAAENQAKLQAELEALRKAEAEREAAELSELERAQKAANEAQAELARAQQEIAQARLEAMRERILSTDASDLPPAYRAQVTGDNEEAIREQISMAREAMKADRVAFLRSLTTVTPDELLAAYGEDAKPLAERIGPRAPSIGQATNAGAQTQNQPAEGWGPTNTTLEAWRKERERRGFGRVTL